MLYCCTKHPYGSSNSIYLLLTIRVLISLMDAEWLGLAEIVMCGLCLSVCLIIVNLFCTVVLWTVVM